MTNETGAPENPGLHLSFLMACPLFEKIPATSRHFKEFVRKIETRSFKKGEQIYSRGEFSGNLFIVRAGEVQIRSHAADGTSHLIGMHGRGSLFGEVSFLSGEKHSSDATASLDSIIYVLPGHAFSQLLKEESALGQSLSLLLSRRLRNRLEPSNEKPSRIHLLYYPENPRRGSEICDYLATALTAENPGPVALFLCHEDSEAHAGEGRSPFWAEIGGEDTATPTRRQVPYDVLNGLDIFRAAKSGNRDFIPSLLGRLKKYYSAILIDAGSNIDDSFLKIIISQSDRIVLVEKGDFSGRKWEEALKICSEASGEFEDRLLTVSDRRAKSQSDIRAGKTQESPFYRDRIFLFSGAGTDLQDSMLRGIRRLARRLSGTSRGLVLGGGGARAFAHAGVIEVLEKAGIDFDAVVGTSMGAVIGAGYAMGMNGQQLQEMLANFLPYSSSILDKNLPFISFFRGKKLNDTLREAFGFSRFDELEIPFFCNACDLHSGRMVVFERGYLASALRASVSLPGIFPPFRLGEYLLVDGGVINNLPGNILREKGFARIIGINVTPAVDSVPVQLSPEKKGNRFKSLFDFLSIPPILKIILRSLSIESFELLKLRMEDFDYIFQPDVSDIDIFDFHLRDRIFEKGREGARRHLSEIRDSLARQKIDSQSG